MNTYFSPLDDDEAYLFIHDDKDIVAGDQLLDTWKIIIVDDEPVVHQVTLLALDDFIFEEKNSPFYPLILQPKPKH